MFNQYLVNGEETDSEDYNQYLGIFPTVDLTQLEDFPIYDENQDEPNPIFNENKDDEHLSNLLGPSNNVPSFQVPSLDCRSSNSSNFANQCGNALPMFFTPANAGFVACSSMKGGFFKMNQKHLKRKIFLSDGERKFKAQIYTILNKGRKFDKYILKSIHDFMKDKLNIPTMVREEFRRIDLYFKHFYKYEDRIIPFLKNNKEDIFEAFLRDKKSNKNK